MSETGDDGRAAREAAEWLARLNSRAVATEDLNAFYEWRRDPANAEAYARGEQVWHDSRALGDDREIAAAVREALERPRLERGKRATITRRLLLAGGGAAVAAAGAAWLLIGRSQGFETEVGQQLLVTLDDGSRMRLNTASQVDTSFSANTREVVVRHGQAFFEVTPDARPFIVRAQGIEAVARSTRFDVRSLEGEPIRILLVEGALDVRDSASGWSRTLSRPGECAFAGFQTAPRVARLDANAATSWTSGRLTFRNTPLAEAVAEVNRYSETKIELRANRFANEEVDGVFETGEPSAFVQAVTALFPLRAQRDSTERILLVGP